MSKQIEALKLALEALESSRVFVTTREKIKHPEGTEWYDQAIIAIKEALAQKEQETVALENVYETIVHWDEGGGKRSRRELARRIVDLYTTPTQRTWVGLTDEDDIDWEDGGNLKDLVKAIEAKLKEKNNV